MDGIGYEWYPGGVRYGALYGANHFNSLSLIFLPKELQVIMQVSEIDDKQVLLECEQTANRWPLLDNEFFQHWLLFAFAFVFSHFVCLLSRLFAFCGQHPFPFPRRYIL